MTAKRILAGFHAVSARLRHAPETIEALYVDARRRDGRMAQLQQRAAELKVKIVAADADRLRGLAGEAPHQGVVAVATHLDESLSLDDVVNDVGPGTLLLLLDGVTDPRNLGACLRVADAAGVQAVIVPRDRSAGMTPAALKAAAGAAEAVPLIAVTNLARAMDDLRDAGVRLVGAAGEAGQSLFDLDLTGPLAWVLGAEGTGLRRLTRERCAALARIPIRGQVESLNVSAATGICLYEAVRQRREARRGQLHKVGRKGKAGTAVRKAKVRVSKRSR
jgi:23S rRNA (guanosine2251-2'-O)-methyltransferase